MCAPNARGFSYIVAHSRNHSEYEPLAIGRFSYRLFVARSLFTFFLLELKKRGPGVLFALFVLERVCAPPAFAFAVI